MKDVDKKLDTAADGLAKGMNAQGQALEQLKGEVTELRSVLAQRVGQIE